MDNSIGIIQIVLAVTVLIFTIIAISTTVYVYIKNKDAHGKSKEMRDFVNMIQMLYDELKEGYNIYIDLSKLVPSSLTGEQAFLKDMLARHMCYIAYRSQLPEYIASFLKKHFKYEVGATIQNNTFEALIEYGWHGKLDRFLSVITNVCKDEVELGEESSIQARHADEIVGLLGILEKSQDVHEILGLYMDVCNNSIVNRGLLYRELYLKCEDITLIKTWKRYDDLYGREDAYLQMRLINVKYALWTTVYGMVVSPIEYPIPTSTCIGLVNQIVRKFIQYNVSSATINFNGYQKIIDRLQQADNVLLDLRSYYSNLEFKNTMLLDIRLYRKLGFTSSTLTSLEDHVGLMTIANT